MAESLLSANNRLIAVDSETTYGTDAFGGSTPDDFIAFDEFEPDTNLEEVADERERATHSGRPHDVFEDSSTVSWALPITGIVDPEGTPEFPLGTLLKASNWAETVEAAPSFEYNLITGNSMDDVPSCTFVYYMIEQARQNALKMIFKGMRGNTTLTLNMGEPAQLSGEYTGQFSAFPTDTVSKPTNPESYLGEENRFIVVGMNLKLDDTSHSVESFEFQTNWDISEDRDATTADTTLASVYLTRSPGSRPEGSTTLKGRSEAMRELIPDIKARETFEFEAILENANNDRLTITAPSLQFGNYSENRDSSIHFDAPCFFNGTGAGEDELILKVDRA